MPGAAVSITRTALVVKSIATIALGTSLIATPSAATPPPPDQLTADCTNPTYASDTLVCADPGLTALDSLVARAVAGAGDAAISPKTPLVEAQGSWLRRRSLCAMQAAHKDCLMAAYVDRLALLKVLDASPPGTGGAWRCEVKRFGTIMVADLHSGQVLLMTPQDRKIIGLASINGTADKAGWTPFLRFVTKGRKAILSDAFGTASPCKAVQPVPPK